MKRHVLVVAGGSSGERTISLLSGREIADALPKGRYRVSFLEISQGGQWLLKDRPIRFEDMRHLKIDVAFLALHGRDGEDGKIQALFEILGISYTGSGVLPSALGMDKQRCYEFLKESGIRLPSFIPVGKHERVTFALVAKIKRNIRFPCIVKPNASGSSLGVSIVETANHLPAAIRKARREDDIVLIQQYIRGREIACSILGNQGGDFLALPPIEIRVHDAPFFDYQAKYDSKATEEICPAPVDKRIERALKETALLIHQRLGCDGLTRSDFILGDKDEKLYFLEINTIPGQTKMSLVPKAATAFGWSFARLCEEQIRLALKKKSH